MSPRAAVFDLLNSDLVLKGEPFNLNENRIWPNFALDGSPREGYYLVLRWGEWTRVFANRGKTKLVIWAYAPRQNTTDYVNLQKILNVVEDLLTSSFNIVGSDGFVFTCADLVSSSEDLVDEGYDAIAKNSTFDIVSRREE